jgi:lysozyme family protein
MADYTTAIDFVLRLEDSTLSGIVTHDSDGITRFGILDKYSHGFVSSNYYTEDVTDALVEAKLFYKRVYWTGMSGDSIISQILATQFLSIAINDGLGTCIKMIQRALATVVDGVLGPITLAKINASNQESLLYAFNVEATTEYNDIVAKDPAKKVYLTGWVNRVTAIYGLH